MDKAVSATESSLRLAFIGRPLFVTSKTQTIGRCIRIIADPVAKIFRDTERERVGGWWTNIDTGEENYKSIWKK